MGLKDYVNINSKNYRLDLDSILESNQDKEFRRVKMSDLESEMDAIYKQGKPMGYSTGLKTLDAVFRWRRKGGLYCFTGYDQSGKSTLLKFLSQCAVKAYKWPVIMFSPEEETDEIVEDIARAYLGANINNIYKGKATESQWREVKDWIESFFVFLEYYGMIDFEKLLKEFTYHAQKGAKLFITDPWNYVAEGALNNDMVGYLKVALSHMKTFSRVHEVQNVIVEHQNNTVTAKENGKRPKPSKWNITGGAMWRNKCDSIVCVHKYWDEETQDKTVDFIVDKSKAQRYNGQEGTRSLYFDIRTGQYHEEESLEGCAERQYQVTPASGIHQDMPF